MMFTCFNLGIMASSASYCGVCSRNLDEEILHDGEFMIQCDICEIWYHGGCVNLEEYEAADIDHYHCPSCLPTAGPSQPKPVRNDHRYDYSDPDAANKPTENGTRRFTRELLKRKFVDASPVVMTMEDGHSLTSAYLNQINFGQPILVKKMDGLGMRVPPSSFTADDVERHVGYDRYVDVIDVYSQHSYKMPLKAFLGFFRGRERPKLYNLISLEFSDTKLTDLIKLPSVVEEMSWVEQYWPKPIRDDLSITQKAVLNEHIAVKPEVSKFCLIGMAGSYTDFHIDFGGTSVFYHVLWGEKVFYLIEPSEMNLRLFEAWQQCPNYAEMFFGDRVSQCFRLVLRPGQTFFIPTGWIHAVYTPKDSLVIGGNFLHSFNIGMQIRIYEMERRMNTAEKFMFPHFELVNWYAGVHLMEMIKELNEERVSAKSYLVDGLGEMLNAMRTWIQRNQAGTRTAGGRLMIETLTCAQVMKQLERALRHNQKIAAPVKKIRRPELVERVEIVQVSKPPALNYSTASVHVPLPKLKLSTKHGWERSKGCPKSPTKIKPQWDDVGQEPVQRPHNLKSYSAISVETPSVVDNTPATPTGRVLGAEDVGMDSDKKVFGFSLLDTHGRYKPSSAVDGLAPAVVSETRDAPVEPRLLSPSSHGRLHKPKQCGLSKRTFLPELGYCRQDDEFVYPSLSDSEDAETRPKRKHSGQGERGASKARLEMVRSQKHNSLAEKSMAAYGATSGVACQSDGQKVPAKLALAGSVRQKKMQKGTTKQRLANKLKIRKLIAM